MLDKIKEWEKHYHKIVFIYSLLFAIYTLFGRVTVLHGLVEHTINGFVFVFAGIFGALLFGIDLLFYRNFMKMKYYLVFVAFIAAAAVSSILNVAYGVRSNLTTLIWLTVQMILLTTMGHLFDREKYMKWLTWFFRVSGVIWGLAAAGSLYQYCFVPGFTIYMNERYIRQSFVENRLFGVFIDPNLGAFVGFLVMWGMVFLMWEAKKRQSRYVGLVKVLAIINIVLQTIYIILSGSRSTEVCMIASISYGLIFLLIKKYQKKQCPLLVKGLSYVAVPIAVAVVLLGSFWGIKKGITTFVTNMSTQVIHEKDELERKDIEGDASNNRMDIWKGYLELWKDKPVFGLSPRNCWNYADKEHPNGYLAQHHYDVHNAYVAVLASMGVVGFAILLVIMFLVAKYLIQKTVNPDDTDMVMFIAIQFILNIAIFIVFYPGIFFTNGIDTVLFWPAIGYLLQSAGSKNKMSIQSTAE